MLLTDGATPLSLPDDLEWTDEFDWIPVEQSAEYSLTGSMVVETAEKLSGRPITLVGREKVAWLSRADVLQLRAWAATPGKVLTLTLADARVFSVLFRHQDAPAIEAAPVLFMAPMEPTDFYVATLKFMEI